MNVNISELGLRQLNSGAINWHRDEFGGKIKFMLWQVKFEIPKVNTQ